MSLTGPIALNPPKLVLDLFSYPVIPALARKFQDDSDWRALNAAKGGNIWKFAVAWLNRQDYDELLAMLTAAAENKQLLMQANRGHPRPKPSAKLFDEAQYRKLWLRGIQLTHDMAWNCPVWARNYPLWSPRLLIYEAPALIVKKEIIEAEPADENIAEIREVYAAYWKALG